MGVLDAPITQPFIASGVYRNRAVDQLVTVASESAWYDSSLSDGTGTFMQTRKRHIVFADSRNPRPAWANFYNRDLTGVNAITVRAGLEIGTDKTATSFLFVPVTFNGQRDAVIQPGETVIADPINIALPAGTVIFSRTLVTVGAVGLKWPLQGSGFNSSNQANTISSWNEGMETGTSYTDKTLSGTITATSGSASYAPVAIFGDPIARRPYIGLDGDSIMSGLGETGPSGIYPDGGRGPVRRALAGAFPYVSIAASGEYSYESIYLREWLLNACSDVVTNIGINDMRASATLAAMQASWIYRWRRFAARGAKVWQQTLTPITTSTDTWATTGNQSKFLSAPQEAIRTGSNDWVRDGAPLTVTSGSYAAASVGATGVLRAGDGGHPLSGFFETADQVETARNSGIWKVGYVYTADSLGLHPSSTGYAAMATAIDTTKFNRVA